MISQQPKGPYIVGRYAPSPTGDLHLGNLRTALIAWLHARSQNGRFLLRIEDTDTPRVVRGSDAKILQDLEWLGIDWDGEVVYQSARHDFYQSAIQNLSQSNLVYPCFCSRKDIRLAGSAPHANPGVYPGLCSTLTDAQVVEKRKAKHPAYRLRVSGDLKSQCGDFVLLRADDIVAYQLAVVVDDLDQGVTDVVRGGDLMSSTERQIYLARLLSPSSTPIRYHHVPLMMDESGERMSKRDGSLSAKEWREQGGTAAMLVARFAQQLGLVEVEEPLSAVELLSRVSKTQIEDLCVE